MESIKAYIDQNKDRFLEELFELLRIPSISSQAEHKPDMLRCAEQWKSILLAAGADKAYAKLKEELGISAFEAELTLLDPKLKPDAANDQKIAAFCEKLK